MTNYKPGVKDGGPQFQAMLQFLLTDGRNIQDPHLKGDFFSATGKWTKDVRDVQDEWNYLDTYGAPKPIYIHENTRVMQGNPKRGGGRLGYNSRATVQKGRNDFPAGFDHDNDREIEPIVSIRPCSKGNYIRAFSLSEKDMKTHGTEHSMWTNGIKGLANEYDGSAMALGNRFAVVIGLYYYPKCENKDFNWRVSHTVQGQTWSIRMRLPNPAYKRGLKDGVRTLTVEQGVNQVALKELSAHPGSNQTNFEVPSIFKAHKLPLTHLQLFCHPATGVRDGFKKGGSSTRYDATVYQTTIAPFFSGEVDESLSLYYRKWAAKSAKKEKDYINKIRKELGGVLHAPEEGEGNLFLGFKMSAALWLYPHYFDKSEVKFGDAGVEPPFQPEPELKPEFRDMRWVGARKINSAYEVFREPPYGIELIKKPLTEGMTAAEAAQMQRFALLGYAQLPTPNVIQAERRDEPDPPEPQDVVGDASMPREDPQRAGRSEMTGPDHDDSNTRLVRNDQVDLNFGDMDTLGVMDVKQMLVHGGNPFEDEKHQNELLADSDKAAPQYEMDEMENGAPRVSHDLNNHFKHPLAQPWPHKDLYESNHMSIRRKKNVDVDAYKEQHGAAANLFLHSRHPYEIEGIDIKYGELRVDIAKRFITDADEPGEQIMSCNLKKILLIYFHDSGLGNKYRKFTTAQKQTAMLAPKTKAKPWNPVFTNKKAELQELLTKYKELGDFDTFSGYCAPDDKGCNICADIIKADDLSMLKSKMTVAEWVTTPWHYAYLPYQSQKAVFRDGETYSEGCIRCSRPFYEFEYHYSAYKYSMKGTRHYPTAYWQVGNAGVAPLPFHEPQFWDKEPTAPVNDAAEVTRSDDVSGLPVGKKRLRTTDDGLGVSTGENWHNWTTHRFKMPATELSKRVGMNKALFRGKDFLHPPTFKKYKNHVCKKGHKYPTFPQGKFVSMHAKVKHADDEYKLMRASRYGNVCVDCAHTLETAPGLFLRNYRVVKKESIVKGDASKQKSSHDWWVDLLKLHPISGVDAGFDPSVLHRDAKGMEYWDKNMKAVEDYLRAWHDVPDGFTKIPNPPEIHTQSALLPRSESRRQGALERQRDDQAIKLLGEMMTKSPEDLTGADWTNPAFKDLISGAYHRACHRRQFTPAKDYEKVFDSDMIRTEHRNQKYTVDGITYHNSLEIVKYRVDKKDGVRGGFTEDEHTVHLATRKGQYGKEIIRGGKGIVRDGKVEVTDQETQWGGDGYLTLPGSGGYNVPAIPIVPQYRKYRQSRLFITYSLHRPVTSEVEARAVMEKMNKATTTLFGDDRFLAHLLIFGQMLTGFKKKDGKGQVGRPDILSSARFTSIPKTNKEADMGTFYGSNDHNSYMFDTYETHVEKVDVDGGIEIGPMMRHPHFHILLTINHWSYVQFDYYKMNYILEMWFKGLDPWNWFPAGHVDSEFKLEAASGDLFYTDNEHPYVDIRLYPQDNWQDIITAYVRKNTAPSIMEAIRIREGNTRGATTSD